MPNTLIEENYLKAIFHLMNDEHQVGINDISKFLNVKMPSVNNMMKKFSDKKLVQYETYKPVVVTEKGAREAALVVRKHRLTEMFLVEKMNFGWENVHEIAEQLEHIHSQVFFDKMDEILNFPKYDPHGEPIPDRDGRIIAKDLRKLSQCQVGEEVIFSSVATTNADFLGYLNDKNLTLGQHLKIIRIEKYDRSMTISNQGKSEILSHLVADRLLVSQ